MKKLLVCLIFVICLASPALSFQNSPDGFRGIKWGDPPSAMGEYTLDFDEDYLKFYLRQDDKMSIGEVPLIKLNYVFCEDRFMSMKTRMEGKHFIDMKQILTQQYGEPIQQNRYIPEYSWIDNIAFITFKNNTVGRYCDLTISSVREIISMDKVQKERAKKASGDF